MTQTAALFLDAYRELNARKMFWITLILSGLVVLAFALIGITETGLKIIIWDIDIDAFNTGIMSREYFYKSMFSSFGINFWLSWLATILALVSTAGIFPEFISGGSIDLVLAKPIGRLRLFITKYATGLLFVTLQVSVFTFACFLVIGFRGGVWEPALLLAIPLVVIFFSYLYSVCVLLGLLTRSTVAALLLTMLFWFVLFGIHTTESAVMGIQLMKQQQVESLENSITRDEAKLDRFAASDEKTDQSIITPIETRLEKNRKKREDQNATLATLDTVHTYAMAVKTALPKTTETITLLDRWLINLAELPAMPTAPNAGSGNNAQGPPGVEDPEKFRNDLMAEIQGRSVFWIIGTSLLFELAILTLAARIFTRRDF